MSSGGKRLLATTSCRAWDREPHKEGFRQGLVWVTFHPSQPWLLVPLPRSPEYTGEQVDVPHLLPGTHLVPMGGTIEPARTGLSRTQVHLEASGQGFGSQHNLLPAGPTWLG